MKVFTLKRLTDMLGKGTPGVLFDGREPFIVTLEPDWVNNEHDISCIPTGEFRCIRHKTEEFGDSFEILCPPRTGVFFHKGNYATDSKGCILLGSYFDELANGTFMIADCNPTKHKFLDRLKDQNEFKLVIENVPWT